jgi:hypothetical protein
VYIGVQKPLMNSRSEALNFSIYERYVKRKVK